jgi:hypothetical protein
MIIDGDEWSTSSPGRFAPVKEPQYQLNRRLFGLQKLSERFREKKNLFLPGIAPRTSIL